jgi:hypothetical protein
MPVFSNCEFPLLDDSETIERVRTAITSREPFSLIRVNDGEAVVLAFDDDMSLQDLAYLHGHWGADRVTLGAIAEVKRDLQIAVHAADVVGVRNDIVNVTLPRDLLDRSGSDIKQYVSSAFKLRQAESDSLSQSSARRLALLHRVLSHMEFSETQRFCSVWIHWELLATGALGRILDAATNVALVTSKPELEHLVARRFDVQTSAVIVPDKFVETKESARHIPDRYRTIRSEFTFPEGTLVLVGAGIPGKIYCQWLKESGCVAIDVGAVFDAWVGKASRPLVLESRFNMAGGARVPPELQLRVPMPQERRRLNPRWKPSGVRD